METFSKEDQQEAKEFFEFYTDLIENHINQLIYSLSDNVTLDWFGKTIKGERDVIDFLKHHDKFNHLLKDPRRVSKIGYRDSTAINFVCEKKKRSSSVVTDDNPGTGDQSTPPKQSGDRKRGETSTSHAIEQGQGDGLHNCEPPGSPVKRCKVDEVAETINCSSVKFIRAEGHVEFVRRSSKKYQKEVKWTRPCKLEIAYSSDNLQDYIVHVIIYSSEMKCKRNLLKDFEAASSD